MNADPQKLPAHWPLAVRDAFWTAVNAPTYEESTAAMLSFARLLDPDPEPRTFSDGGVNDIRQLYAVQDAITAAGGELTRPVHRAIDALREVWDRELRREQEKQPAAGGVVSAAPDQAATLPTVGVFATLVRERADHLEAALGRMRDRLEVTQARVRRLHTADANGECQHCHHSYPCLTVQALDDPADTLRRVAAEAQQQDGTETLVGLIRDFLDPDPCRLDHHGYCQAHSWMCGGSPCPHRRAREVLAAIDVDTPAVSGPRAADDKQDGAQT